MTKIKICGLTRVQDIEAVNRWRPDYIGFVFAKSKRQITSCQANMLKDKLSPDIKAAGVFVNASVQMIVSLFNAGVIEIVQLHGDEDEDYIKELKEALKCPVIKAVSVRSKEQILSAEHLDCDFLLLDTYHKGKRGGSGIAFDHALIPALTKPYFLAGGLNNCSIGRAILDNHPYGVDISSGVETDGVKDERKIKEIIETIRMVDRERGQ